MALLFLAFLAFASAEVYFKETFDDTWEERWVTSDWKKSSGQAGDFVHTAGKWYADEEADKGIQTSQDARFYSLSAGFDKFSNKGKDLVVQFSVKHEQNIDCGGGYVKLFPSSLDQEHMSGDSVYNIMFGPDICGHSTKKVHVIFNYNDKNLLLESKTITAETNELTHVYTLILHSDNTYEVRIDGDKKESGDLKADWDFLEAEKIKDPDMSKPEDWVDEVKIDDPEDAKPDGWDDEPKQIPDPEAGKPEDWDDEDDGEWEAPMIDNPDFKGEWKATRIANPDYIGKWVHPEIDNPDYVDDQELYLYEDNAFIGFDLWQVKGGSIFDNVIICDTVEEADSFMEETYAKTKDGEREMFDAAEKAKRDAEEAERAKAEEERKKQEEEDEEEDEDEEDEDEDEAEAEEGEKTKEEL